MTSTANRLSDIEIRERLGYINFTDEDAKLLNSLRSWMQEEVKDFVTKFYDPQFRQPEFLQVVSANNSSRGVLEQAQAGYCMDLFDGYPSQAYVAKRVRIGRRHSILGVTPRWFTSSYQFYYDLLLPMVRERLKDEPGKGEQAADAIMKLLNFDQQLMMQEYVDGLSSDYQAMIAEVAVSVAKGDLDVQGAKLFKEGGVIGEAFQEMITYIQDMATVAESIANGDLTVNVEAKSDKDALGIAFVNMVNNLRDMIGQVTDAANNLTQSSGDLSLAAEHAGMIGGVLSRFIQEAIRVGKRARHETLLATSPDL